MSQLFPWGGQSTGPCYYNLKTSHSTVSEFIYTLDLGLKQSPFSFLFISLHWWALNFLFNLVFYPLKCNLRLYLISPTSQSRKLTFSLPSTPLLLLDHLCKTFYLLSSINSSPLKSMSDYHFFSIFVLLSTNFQVIFPHSEDCNHSNIWVWLPFPSGKISSSALCWLYVPPLKRGDFFKVLLSLLSLVSLGTFTSSAITSFQMSLNSTFLFKPSLNYRLEFPTVS